MLKIKVTLAVLVVLMASLGLAGCAGGDHEDGGQYDGGSQYRDQYLDARGNHDGSTSEAGRQYEVTLESLPDTGGAAQR